jgi:hypothetical protein
MSSSCRANPAVSCLRHRGASLRDTVVLVGLFAVTVAVVSSVVMRNRQRSRVDKCAADLRSIATGLHTSVGPSGDDIPVPPHAGAVEDGVGRVRYAPGLIGANREYGVDFDYGQGRSEDTELSTTRAFWLLVRNTDAGPDLFICPSSESTRNTDANLKLFWDFARYSEVSYGFQVFFGRTARPSVSRGTSEVVWAADKGPFGAALEAGRPYPGVPDVLEPAGPEAWRKWNSPNHGGLGQNVMFADAHVDWSSKPTAGPGFDNIYTRWSNSSVDPREARTQGTPPTGIETPFGRTDALLYP